MGNSSARSHLNFSQEELVLSHLLESLSVEWTADLRPWTEPLLVRLWNALHKLSGHNKDPPPFQRISPAWQRFGFTHEDPSIQLRTVGKLGLANLVFFVERFPERAKKLAGLCRDEVEVALNSKDSEQGGSIKVQGSSGGNVGTASVVAASRTSVSTAQTCSENKVSNDSKEGKPMKSKNCQGCCESSVDNPPVAGFSGTAISTPPKCLKESIKRPRNWIDDASSTSSDSPELSSSSVQLDSPNRSSGSEVGCCWGVMGVAVTHITCILFGLHRGRQLPTASRPHWALAHSVDSWQTFFVFVFCLTHQIWRRWLEAAKSQICDDDKNSPTLSMQLLMQQTATHAYHLLRNSSPIAPTIDELCDASGIPPLTPHGPFNEVQYRYWKNLLDRAFAGIGQSNRLSVAEINALFSETVEAICWKPPSELIVTQMREKYEKDRASWALLDRAYAGIDEVPMTVEQVKLKYADAAQSIQWVPPTPAQVEALRAAVSREKAKKSENENVSKDQSQETANIVQGNEGKNDSIFPKTESVISPSKASIHLSPFLPASPPSLSLGIGGVGGKGTDIVKRNICSSVEGSESGGRSSNRKKKTRSFEDMDEFEVLREGRRLSLPARIVANPSSLSDSATIRGQSSAVVQRATSWRTCNNTFDAEIRSLQIAPDGSTFTPVPRVRTSSIHSRSSSNIARKDEQNMNLVLNTPTAVMMMDPYFAARSVGGTSISSSSIGSKARKSKRKATVSAVVATAASTGRPPRPTRSLVKHNRDRTDSGPGRTKLLNLVSPRSIVRPSTVSRTSAFPLSKEEGTQQTPPASVRVLSISSVDKPIAPMYRPGSVNHSVLRNVSTIDSKAIQRTSSRGGSVVGTSTTRSCQTFVSSTRTGTTTAIPIRISTAPQSSGFGSSASHCCSPEDASGSNSPARRLNRSLSFSEAVTCRRTNRLLSFSEAGIAELRKDCLDDAGALGEVMQRFRRERTGTDDYNDVEFSSAKPFQKEEIEAGDYNDVALVLNDTNDKDKTGSCNEVKKDVDNFGEDNVKEDEVRATNDKENDAPSEEKDQTEHAVANERYASAQFSEDEDDDDRYSGVRSIRCELDASFAAAARECGQHTDSVMDSAEKALEIRTTQSVSSSGSRKIVITRKSSETFGDSGESCSDEESTDNDELRTGTERKSAFEDDAKKSQEDESVPASNNEAAESNTKELNICPSVATSTSEYRCVVASSDGNFSEEDELYSENELYPGDIGYDSDEGDMTDSEGEEVIQVVMVHVPLDWQVGQHILVTMTDGHRYTLSVPPGIGPGDTFEAELRSHMPEPEVISVPVPLDWEEGQGILLNMTDGRRYTLAVPAGVGPGEFFRAHLRPPNAEDQSHINANNNSNSDNKENDTNPEDQVGIKDKNIQGSQLVPEESANNENNTHEDNPGIAQLPKTPKWFHPTPGKRHSLGGLNYTELSDEANREHDMQNMKFNQQDELELNKKASIYPSDQQNLESVRHENRMLEKGKQRHEQQQIDQNRIFDELREHHEKRRHRKSDFGNRRRRRSSSGSSISHIQVAPPNAFATFDGVDRGEGYTRRRSSGGSSAFTNVIPIPVQEVDTKPNVHTNANDNSRRASGSLHELGSISGVSSNGRLSSGASSLDGRLSLGTRLGVGGRTSLSGVLSSTGAGGGGRLSLGGRFNSSSTGSNNGRLSLGGRLSGSGAHLGLPPLSIHQPRQQQQQQQQQSLFSTGNLSGRMSPLEMSSSVLGLNPMIRRAYDQQQQQQTTAAEIHLQKANDANAIAEAHRLEAHRLTQISARSCGHRRFGQSPEAQHQAASLAVEQAAEHMEIAQTAAMLAKSHMAATEAAIGRSPLQSLSLSKNSIQTPAGVQGLGAHLGTINFDTMTTPANFDTLSHQSQSSSTMSYGINPGLTPRVTPVSNYLSPPSTGGVSSHIRGIGVNCLNGTAVSQQLVNMERELLEFRRQQSELNARRKFVEWERQQQQMQQQQLQQIQRQNNVAATGSSFSNARESLRVSGYKDIFDPFQR